MFNFISLAGLLQLRVYNVLAGVLWQLTS